MSNQKKTVIKPQAISGFLEFTPSQQVAAQAILDDIRHHFELFGFTPIETPAVERLEVLLAKGGDTDKEMFLLQRLQADQEDANEPKLGLHYDLTVPFARYVAQHFNSIVFPFKRYQMQYCWRGERPQDGRYRQFFQCDIDVVAVDRLALSFDSEIPLLAWEVLDRMKIGDFTFRISNRKILDGFLLGLGLPEGVETSAITRILDKLEKIGKAKVEEGLVALGISPEQAGKCLEIAGLAVSDLSFGDKVRALGVQHERLELGLEELTAVMSRLQAEHPGSFVADLSVTRGFDYYTGTVYEVRWNDHPGIGSIAAGGRYDDLASNYTNHKLPGVGMSIGFSRIFAKLLSSGQVKTDRHTPTQVLVTWLDESSDKAQAVASGLRKRGIRCEVYHENAKLTKQLTYANKKGIAYVLFDTDLEIKNMISGEQTAVDPATWQPEL